MINVKLESGEAEVAQIIGKARTRANREKGIFNRLRTHDDPIQTEIDGLGAVSYTHLRAHETDS